MFVIWGWRGVSASFDVNSEPVLFEEKKAVSEVCAKVVFSLLLEFALSVFVIIIQSVEVVVVVGLMIAVTSCNRAILIVIVWGVEGGRGEGELLVGVHSDDLVWIVVLRCDNIRGVLLAVGRHLLVG